MADRLTLAHAIEDAGIERTRAEALAGAILEAIHDNVATKVDIRELRGDTKELRSELKADIEGLRAETKADIQQLRSELKADIQEVRSEVAQMATNLRAEMALLEHRLLTRLGGLIVVLLGLLFAALHAWPPGHG
jgi:hypothetical protein